MEKTFEIWCRSTNDKNEKIMYWCKTIYQKWNEGDYPYRRRTKRIFKKYKNKNQKEGREFYLIEIK